MSEKNQTQQVNELAVWNEGDKVAISFSINNAKPETVYINPDRAILASDKLIEAAKKAALKAGIQPGQERVRRDDV